MRKRLLSTLLALCMALSLIPFGPFAVQAEAMGIDNAALDIVPGYTDAEDFGLTGSGGFGGMLTAAVEEKSAALADEYAVTDLTMEGAAAIVAYQTGKPATIFVALYDEETKQMNASDSTSVSQAGSEAKIWITGEIPEYFIVRAFLLDSDTSSPLCGEFTSYRYTRELFELEGKTLEDFAGEYGEDLIFDIDGQKETNFGVYKKGTTVTEASSVTNVLTDNGSGTYTVTNADASFTSLAAGDTVSYTMEDGAVLLIKVANVAVTGATVTITEDPEADLTDFFDYLKIDADSGGSNIIIEDDTSGFWEEGEVTPYLYGSEYQSVPVAALAEENTGDELEYSHGLQFKITEKKFGNNAANVTAEAAFTVQFTAKLKYYLTPKYQDIALTLENKVTLSGTLEGELNAEIPLKGIKIPLLTGIVYAEMTPNLVFRGTCKLEGSFSIESTIGFGYNNKDRFRSLNSGPTPDASVRLEGEIFVGFNPELSLEIFDANIAAATVSGTMGLNITGELKGSVDELLDEDTKHECDACIKGEVEFIGKVDVELSIADGWIEKLEFNVLALSYKVGDFYYSVDHKEFGWGECPHFLYRVTLATVNEIGKPEPEISISSSSFKPEEDGSLPGYITDASGIAKFYLGNGSHILELRGVRARAAASVTVQDGPTSVRVTLHTLVRHAKKDATCTEDGIKQYYTCSVCGKLFKDLFAEKETTAEDTVIEKLGHDFSGGYGYDDNTHWKGCVRGDIIEEGSEGPHDFPEGSDTCSVCGYKKDLGDDGDDGDGGDGGGCGHEYETDEEGRIKYPVVNGYIYLAPSSGLITKCDSGVTEANIPSSIYGFTVTGIGEFAFSRCYSLKKVSIPGSAETIYPHAFNSCSALTDLTISEGVKFIQSEAFTTCRALTEITIPASVDVIGEEAFFISGLERVTILGDTTRIDGFQSCKSLVSVTIHGNVSNLGGFVDCSVLSDITVHGSVDRIEDSAFMSCRALKNIAIEGGITHIGAKAFSNCESLTEAPIPEGVLTIGEYAFQLCYALTRVTIPESVTSLGEYVFYGCSSLSTARVLCDVDILHQFSTDCTDITVYGNVGRIDNGAFAYNSSLARLTIYGDVGAIEGGAFSSSCNNWREFTVYGRIGSIGEGAFTGCGLTDVTFTGGVGSMGDNAFAYCAKLERFHTGPTSIPSEAFYECSSIKSLTFTGDVVVGAYAFDELESLTGITVRDGVCRAEDGAFTGCSNLTTISGTVNAVGTGAFSKCKSLTGVTIGGSMIGKQAFYMCSALETVNILDGVKTIGEFALNGCVNLSAVELPDSVTDIEYGAFNWCSSLERVNIPDGVTEIGGSAFSYCGSLKGIHIPESVSSIGASAFENCTQLAELNLPEGITSIGRSIIRNTAIQSITIPSTLTAADYHSGYKGALSYSNVKEIIFADGLAVIPENTCNYMESLVRVVIPGSVEEIGANAFASCANLQDVVYLGTDAQWKCIQIDSGNSCLINRKPQS